MLKKEEELKDQKIYKIQARNGHVKRWLICKPNQIGWKKNNSAKPGSNHFIKRENIMIDLFNEIGINYRKK